MAGEMEKVPQEAIAKKLAKVPAWLSLLSAAIYAFVHESESAAESTGLDYRGVFSGAPPKRLHDHEIVSHLYRS